MSLRAINMPKVTDKDSLLEHWRGEIKRAIRFREQFGVDDQWPLYRDYYRHFFEEGEVNFNLVYASLASESPTVMFNFPHIAVTALRSGYEPFAYVVEAIDNRLAYQQNLAEENRDILIDIGTCGIGAMILGYDSQFGYSLDIPGAKEKGETLSQYGKDFKRLEYETTIQRGMPWALRCLPENFLVPWGLSRFSETPWFAFRVSRPLRDVKDDSKLSAKVRKSIEASGQTGEYQPPTAKKYDSGGFPEELRPVFMWQIHDRRSGKVLLMADGADDFLRNEDDALQTELGLPAETVQFIKDPVWFWGIPEIRYYHDHQQEMNEIIDQRRAFRKAAILRIIAPKGVFTKEEKAKLLGSEPVILLEVDMTTGQDVRSVIQTFQPSIPPDLTLNKEDLMADVRTLTGRSKPYMGEQLGKTHITKYETKTAIDQAGNRDLEKREKLARFIERVMSKENELIFRNWSSERVERVVGPDLLSYWVRFSGSNIRSSYLLQASVEDMAPMTRETKLKEAGELLEVMAKDQMFQQMYPEAAMQVRKVILSQYGWLNFRRFEPREGVGGNQGQPMSMGEFANEFPNMQKRGSETMSTGGGV